MREADGPRPSPLHTDLKNDAEVAVEALRGSGAACEALVRRFERPVYNLIARLVQDPGMAEDLTQESFVKMFRALGTFDPQQRFSSWLFRIAHNTALDWLRRSRPQVVSLDDPEDAVSHGALAAAAPPTADPVERAALGEALEAAMQTLRPAHRAAVALRYEQDLSFEEIGQVLGVPEVTARSYVHRARKALAQALTDWQPVRSG